MGMAVADGNGALKETSVNPRRTLRGGPDRVCLAAQPEASRVSGGQRPAAWARRSAGRAPVTAFPDYGSGTRERAQRRRGGGDCLIKTQDSANFRRGCIGSDTCPSAGQLNPGVGGGRKTLGVTSMPARPPPEGNGWRGGGAAGAVRGGFGLGWGVGDGAPAPVGGGGFPPGKPHSKPPLEGEGGFEGARRRQFQRVRPRGGSA